MIGQDHSIRPFTRSEKAFSSAFISLLKETDFDSIRVKDIIERSGFSRGSFYTRFTDKYDLANKIIDHEIHTYVESGVEYLRLLEEGVGYQQMLSSMTRIQQRIFDNRDLYDVILDSQYPGVTLDDYCNRLRALMAERISATHSGAISNRSYDLYAYREFYSSILYIKYWQLHGFKFTPEEMATMILDIHNFDLLKFSFASV